MGVVARNERGQVLVVRSLVKPGRLSPLAAEAWAGGQALIFGKDVGLRKIILEGDSKLMVATVNGRDASGRGIGHLIEDRYILLQPFNDWKVMAVRRSANQAAHEVARMAIRANTAWTWHFAYPDCIHEIIIGETPSSNSV
ncbi:uncharacterized protein LOC132169594 [Corylus avellana]|uniref:uncharacterized protein LOC132169594 n=1 Tax=Corylus avellana TaxID=13451 RepID=UPI00286C9F3D|nr:uncharacterized protein LOC132169594 [Corylus avellana]